VSAESEKTGLKPPLALVDLYTLYAVMPAGSETFQSSLRHPPALEVGRPAVSPVGALVPPDAMAAGTSKPTIKAAIRTAILTLNLVPITKKVHLRGLIIPY